MKMFFIVSFLTLVFLINCKESYKRINQEITFAKSARVSFAGVRSSRYGIKPFPQPDEWKNAIKSIKGYFEGATPCAIWIVGILNKKIKCKLGFPSDKKYKNVEFCDSDKNEDYLQLFDKEGIKVFLQVEPANADVINLIDLVLDRYKHHPCVIGLGIDVEWFKEFNKPGRGEKVKDETARLWEERVKKHNPDYRLFLKHWDRKWMPPNYRGDIIFISDSQQLKTFAKMMDEFTNYWAAYFKPNAVGFQIGYRSDYVWWKKFKNPVKSIGEALSQKIPQECSIFWVDFTLRTVVSFE